MFRAFCFAACLVVAWISAAQAQQGLPPSLLDRARAAIAAGQLDEADRVLAGAQDELVDRNDLDFLRGAIALERGDYDKAIAAFRAIVARDPSLNRVRLELARAFFLSGDDEAAEHHFHIAEAAGLPDEVQRKVDQFLDDIKRRKSWGIDVAVGVAPDTNINAGTASRTVNIYGLPFTLDDNARKQSGVGFAGSIGASYQIALDADTRLMVGGRFNDLDYEGNQFDDRNVSGFLGPRFLLGNGSDVSVAATASRRWYAGTGYSIGTGGRISGESALSPRLLLSASLDVQRLVYDDIPDYTGPVVAANLGLTYGLDEVSFLRFDLALMREQARAAEFRDTQYFAGANYFRELPWGFGVNVGAGVAIGRYDPQIAAFDLTRHDTTLTYRFALSNRNIDLYGFTPVITYIHTDRESNIDLYSFGRDRAEFSLIRNF